MLLASREASCHPRCTKKTENYRLLAIFEPVKSYRDIRFGEHWSAPDNLLSLKHINNVERPRPQEKASFYLLRELTADKKAAPI